MSENRYIIGGVSYTIPRAVQKCIDIENAELRARAEAAEKELAELKEANKSIAAEAIFGFCGWLTGQKAQVVFSSHDDASIVAKVAGDFCDANGFEIKRQNWTEFLVYPKPQEVE